MNRASAIAGILILSVLLSGCTVREKDSVKVFEHFFGHKPAPELRIIKASYRATYRIGLDEEELVLELSGPRELVSKLVDVPDNQLLKNPSKEARNAVFAFGDEEFGLIAMERYAPTWFTPRKSSEHTLKIDEKRNIPIFRFEAAETHYIFWQIHPSSGGVYADLKAGRAYIHLTVP